MYLLIINLLISFYFFCANAYTGCFQKSSQNLKGLFFTPQIFFVKTQMVVR